MVITPDPALHAPLHLHRVWILSSGQMFDETRASRFQHHPFPRGGITGRFEIDIGDHHALGMGGVVDACHDAPGGRGEEGISGADEALLDGLSAGVQVKEEGSVVLGSCAGLEGVGVVIASDGTGTLFPAVAGRVQDEKRSPFSQL